MAAIVQLLTVLEVTTCTACLTTQLILVQRCALIEIGGLSLALRGPDGSAQKALHHMRLEVRRCQKMMIRGVQFLALTILVLLLKDLPLPVAIVPFVVCAARFLWAAQNQHRIEKEFELLALRAEEAAAACSWYAATVRINSSASAAERNW